MRAPSRETHATGTPGGIWTMARIASRPPRALLDDEGHADHREVGVRGGRAGESGGHARSGDDDPHAAKRRRRGVLGDAARVPVRGQDVELVGDAAGRSAPRWPDPCARGPTPSRSGFPRAPPASNSSITGSGGGRFRMRHGERRRGRCRCGTELVGSRSVRLRRTRGREPRRRSVRCPSRPGRGRLRSQARAFTKGRPRVKDSAPAASASANPPIWTPVSGASGYPRRRARP